MMTRWMMRTFPLKIRFLIFYNSLFFLNAHSNESNSNNEWNFDDPHRSIGRDEKMFTNMQWIFNEDPSLKTHYDKIVNLLEKSVSGQQLIRFENEELPNQAWGCVPGNLMIIAAFPIHKRSKTSETYPVCSDKIDAAAIVDIKNAFTRLDHFSEMLNIMDKDYKIDFLENDDQRGKIKIGMYLFDDCNDENLAQKLILFVAYWSYMNPDKNPCLLHSSFSEMLMGAFSSFPRRSINSTFSHVWETIHYDIPEVEEITKQEVQNFSFETFEDNYIVCSILRHFEWTRIALVYETNTQFDVRRFLKIAEFFNICVEEVPVDVEIDVRTYRESLNAKCFDGIRVFVIFCSSSRVFGDLIKLMKEITFLFSIAQPDNEYIFITSEDSLPQDRTLMLSSKFLVFHKEAKKVRNDSMDDEKLKLMEEYIMENGTFNSTYEKSWLNELECKFPKNEFAFVQNNKSNTKENGNEFPDFYISSDGKCKRLFLSKLDEIIYRFIIRFCSLKETCRPILKKLLMQFNADHSWLALSYTINLRIEPINISLGYGTWDVKRRRIAFETLPNVTKYLSARSKCRTTSECRAGQKEKILSVNEPCCLECVDCKSDQISFWYECQTCPSEEWPNTDRTVCMPKKKRPLQWNDLEIGICLIYSAIIMIMVVTTFWIFVKNRNTPVVKSSTRELSFMMLVSMIAIESIIFIFMSRPENPLCNLIQIVPSLSFGTIYTSLLVRTVRIARLLALSRTEFPKQNMKCMSTKSQVIITINVIIVELVISLLMLHYATPLLYKNRDYNPPGSEAPMLTPICQYKLKSFTSNFSFIFGLIALCTGCAVWVRKVPYNFNEAKYIGFCMYATCLTWTSFGFTLFAEHDYEILALCACFSTNNLLALIFLFFPKLYIIIFKPKKNHKKYFKTLSESMRVHTRDSRKTNVLLKNLNKRKN